MPVRIRLRRVGRKKQPSYRIVVAESQNPRGGAYIDNVGFYNPRREPVELRVDLAKVDHWVGRGAQLTPTVASLVKQVRREATPAEPVEAKKPARKAKAAEPVVAAAPEKVAETPAAEPAAE